MDFMDTKDNQSSPETKERVEMPGRNEACFCGSGKKFKKCCLPQVRLMGRALVLRKRLYGI